MAREPHDVFMKEFYMHPGWHDVLENLEELIVELKERVLLGSKDEFEHRKGVVEGVYECMSKLRMLIKAKG